jgi:hypothetical protein
MSAAILAPYRSAWRKLDKHGVAAVAGRPD